MTQGIDRDISNLTADLPDQVILFVSYYRCQSDERQAELNFCLEQNLKCRNLERIVLLCEGGIRPMVADPKFCIVQVNNRLTYRDIFNYGQTFNADGVSIFCNSDIFLTEEAVRQIKERIPKYSKNFLALTRWNWHDGKPEMNEKSDSQDTWAWFGIVPDSVKADFHFGKPGCDNAIAQRLQYKYKVTNPSLSIKTYHVHASGEHTYNRSDTIPPPYFYPSITE